MSVHFNFHPADNQPGHLTLDSADLLVAGMLFVCLMTLLVRGCMTTQDRTKAAVEIEHLRGGKPETAPVAPPGSIVKSKGAHEE